MVSEQKSLRAVILLFFIGAVVAALIFAVPLLFDLDSYGKEAYRYNRYTFTLEDGVWSTETQEGGNLLVTALRHGPLELEDIPVRGSIMDFRARSDFFYVTFDPDPENHNGFVTMANAEVSPNMVLHFGKGVAAGCVRDHPDCSSTGTPIITCDNTDEAVIFLKRSEENYIEVAGNCAVISGMDNDLVRAADRFMYGMYGIMK